MNALQFRSADFAGASAGELLECVQVHKYLINQSLPYEISLEDAFNSWNELVHEPLSQAIEVAGLVKEFPQTGEGELFLWVCRHWHFMKQESCTEVPASEAVLDFGKKFAHDSAARFSFAIQKFLFSQEIQITKERKLQRVWS